MHLYLHQVHYSCAWDTHCGICSADNVVAGEQEDAVKSQNEQLSSIVDTDWLAAGIGIHPFRLDFVRVDTFFLCSYTYWNPVVEAKITPFL